MNVLETTRAVVDPLQFDLPQVTLGAITTLKILDKRGYVKECLCLKSDKGIFITSLEYLVKLSTVV
jgi:hypothetical protein